MGAVTYAQFALATLLPVAAAMIMYLVQRDTAFGKLSYWKQQCVIGLVFGLIAVCGTEFGIDTADATMNVRDAPPIIAGLLFGGPAGIIAGLIGGIERWFAVLWGRGMFTRVGCTVATIAVGFYAAALRKYMFDDKKPSWLLALAIGVVAEVLHLTLIFITNTYEIERAIIVVRACAVPMILCNGISVMLAVIAVTLLSRERVRPEPPERTAIAQMVQSGMLVAVVLAFVATTVFTYWVQTGLMEEQTSTLLSLNIGDVRGDVRATSDANVLKAANTVASLVPSVEDGKDMDLNELAEAANVTEISLIDESGTIVASTNSSFVGFDMSSGAQSSEFMVLLDGDTTEFVQSYQPITYERTSWRKFAGVAIPGGFVQVGYTPAEYQSDIANEVANITKYRHVGENGSVIIANAEDVVVSAYDDIVGQTLESTGLSVALENAQPGELFKATYLGQRVYCMMEEAEGYHIIALQPVSEAHFARNAAVMISAFMEVIIFAALFTVIYFLVKHLVVDNIHRINNTLAKITDGDLNASVDVRSNEEFASLSDDINLTVDALKRAIDEAAARIDAELEYARTIQIGALPRVFPPYPTHTEFQIYASMDAAKEVGGDFYDFYLLDEDHLAFLIADVSGKGIPAAMFMMTSKTLLKSLAESGLPVEQVFEKGNYELCQNNDAEMFVTCWMGVLDLRNGRVTFANAGHNPPAIAHEGGTFSFHVTRPNLVLAGLGITRYRAHELTLEPGDTIFLYTDGVTEATDVNNQLFGDDRLLASLDARAAEDVQTICVEVHNDVDAFVGDAPQFDDITVLALRYVGRDEQ